MALKLELISGTISVVSRLDDAISCTEEDYNEYLLDLDEGHLNIKEGQKPTYFVLTKNLKFDAQQKVKNQQISYKGGQVDLQLGFIMEEVRQALVDIKNPDDIPDNQKVLFKRDSDGAASKELIASLGDAIVNDLFSARRNSVGSKASDIKKKSQP